ncbi:MAG: Bax inhibitor-1/YccA family protein [Alphaproteobacteria bacterium GM7ARS4]|nr:Bax inhibitor-1/YccA family protein [Alphaproteobacteria bacterium GM7ARS4]
MASFDYRTQTQAGRDVAFSQGLRTHMLQVYNYMASGLFLTGIVAWLAFNNAVVVNGAGDITGLTSFGDSIYNSGLRWVIMFAPLAFMLVLSFGVERLRYNTLQLIFWAFSVAMGLSLASIFMVYTGNSIARVFFITAASFAGLSLYGYTTQRDLTGFGTFLIMGLIGLIVASIVNIFLASSMLHFIISVVGVLVFAGLTAYDTQNIKRLYLTHASQGSVGGEEVRGKMVVMGAVSLYLDFINLFLMLLRFFGERR